MLQQDEPGKHCGKLKKLFRNDHLLYDATDLRYGTERNHVVRGRFILSGAGKAGEGRGQLLHIRIFF